MNKLVFFFFLIFNLTYSQVKYSIYDSQTKLPISYANIWKEKMLYISTDSLGEFVVKDKDLKDNFKITAIGYNDTIIQLNENNIYIKSSKILLDEVRIIKRKNEKAVKIGKAKRGDTVYGVQYDAKNGKCAKYFLNQNDGITFLNKIKFVALTSDKNRIVNLVFYSVGINGEPKEILNTENKIIQFKKGNHTIEVDVCDLNIEFPKEGIFVVIQHLLLEQNKNYAKPYYPNAFVYEPCIWVDYCDEYKDTWYFKDDKWEKNNRFSINMEISISN
ncbi:hypothetical protein OX283_005125 [Flavobacterium sp. SUN052]|uniref:hypothetical protein n=1 Tax=Flavobacterium sp. SUN052 TaxID=3002441 RepID=UPI00237EA87A|nr:hypothetical protein [Flavobacterium sp. SUN052]MEC4004027.1 hypothetical protein [Flavobacterium sp. SUN052]